MEKPLLDKKLLLEKYPGKGGWTYARVPGIKRNKNKAFGFVKVKGSIDGVGLKHYHLMPMSDGNLFLPVKAAIRKKINKEEGDYVQVILYYDNEPLEVPEELLLCLGDEPRALEFFRSLSESEQRYYIDWVYTAKKEATKVERMARTVNRLLEGKKFYEPA